MSGQGFSLFDTDVGRCAITWGTDGIVGVQLPARSDEATRTRVRIRHPDAVEQTPPADVTAAIDDIRQLLSGEARDLTSIRLDMSAVADFDRRVYDVARAIGVGQTATYGELAIRLGDVGLSRAVGQALGRNPFPIIVPCHRVLAAGGKTGGFSAPGGVTTKRQLLEIEGARLHPWLPWDQTS